MSVYFCAGGCSYPVGVSSVCNVRNKQIKENVAKREWRMILGLSDPNRSNVKVAKARSFRTVRSLESKEPTLLSGGVLIIYDKQ